MASGWLRWLDGLLVGSVVLVLLLPFAQSLWPASPLQWSHQAVRPLVMAEHPGLDTCNVLAMAALETPENNALLSGEETQRKSSKTKRKKKKSARKKRANRGKKAVPPPLQRHSIDLNRATATELERLPGIGPVMAQRIVAHRQLHGPFLTTTQVQDVKGIGPKLYAKLAPYLREPTPQAEISTQPATSTG